MKVLREDAATPAQWDDGGKKKGDGSPHVDVFMALLNLSLFPHIANIEEILCSCAVLGRLLPVFFCLLLGFFTLF